MSKKATINQEMISKAWKLHKSAVSEALIAETLGCSKITVNRIVKLMEAAQNGENVDKILGDRSPRLKKMVKEYFGITEKVETQKIPSDYRDFMVRVLAEFYELNKNLEKLLAELGVGE